MSGPNRYVPSEEPIRCYSTQCILAANHAVMVDLIKLVLEYGPVPSNYKIVILSAKILETHTDVHKLGFVEVSISITTVHHPCSPAGIQAREPIGREFDDDREDETGIFHPALPPHKAGRLLFTEQTNWQYAIADSLTSVGIKNNNEDITAQIVENIHNQLEERAVSDPNWSLQQELYHTADRETIVFKKEPEMARIAKFFGQDLVVLCPPIPKDGSRWNYFWNAVNRPPLPFRHGPGEQCRNQFIVVACFPGYGGTSQDVHWLTVRPTNDFKATWDSYLKRYV
jgi:hypothetical protein